MNKEPAWFLLGIILCLFLIGISSALDEQTIIPCGGDSELYIQCVGDDELNFLGFLEEESIATFGVGGRIVENGKILGLEPIVFWVLVAGGILLLFIIFFVIAYYENRRRKRKV